MKIGEIIKFGMKHYFEVKVDYDFHSSQTTLYHCAILQYKVDLFIFQYFILSLGYGYLILATCLLLQHLYKLLSFSLFRRFLHIFHGHHYPRYFFEIILALLLYSIYSYLCLNLFSNTIFFKFILKLNHFYGYYLIFLLPLTKKLLIYSFVLNF